MATPRRAVAFPATAPRFDLRAVLSSSQALYAFSILIGLLIWELTSRGVSHLVLAPPSAVFLRLAEGIASGVLPLALLHSLGALLVGYAIAIAIAVPLGFLMGRSEAAFTALDPVISSIYSLPPVAFIPFLIIWFGFYFPARVALIVLMSVFEMIVTISAGMRDVGPRLTDVARSFDAGRMTLFVKVILPASMPFIFTALRIGLVRSINAMITAELFFAAVNLGKLMKDDQHHFDSAGLLSIILMLSIFGLLAQEAFKIFEARMLPWHIRDAH